MFRRRSDGSEYRRNVVRRFTESTHPSKFIVLLDGEVELGKLEGVEYNCCLVIHFGSVVNLVNPKGETKIQNELWPGAC